MEPPNPQGSEVQVKLLSHLASSPRFANDDDGDDAVPRRDAEARNGCKRRMVANFIVLVASNQACV